MTPCLIEQPVRTPPEPRITLTPPQAELAVARDERRRRRSAPRVQLIRRVRREIAAGVYATPERFDYALMRCLARLAAPTPPGKA